MRDGHLKPEVFYATNQMKKKPNLDKIVKYLPNTRISSKKYKIDNQVSLYWGCESCDSDCKYQF